MHYRKRLLNILKLDSFCIKASLYILTKAEAKY